MRTPGDLARNLESVLPSFSTLELAILADALAFEVASRRVVGVAALGTVSRSLRERADAEAQYRARIFSADCSREAPG